MTILLMILKIIGYILLVLLLLVLILLLLVLFCPVTYQAKGSIREQKLTGYARVSWLFRLMNVHVRYEESGMRIYLRIFGFPIRLQGYDKPEPEDKKAPEPASSAQRDIVPLHAASTAERDALPAQKDDSGNAGSPEDDTLQDKPDASADFSKKDESDRPKKDTIVQKIRRIRNSLAAKIKNIKNTVHKISRILQDSANQEAFDHIKQTVFRLLKCIMPSKLKLDASYSTGSPDTTAQVFGILAMFPFGYTNRWKIFPDFEAEEAYADGELDIKGHFMIVRLLALLLGLLFDKKCRRLLRMLKRL